MKESKTEKEIYISNLEDIIERVKEKYNINIWFIEIFGKRRSFIAGNLEKLPISDFEIIKITEKFGFVIAKNTDMDIQNSVTELIKANRRIVYGM